MKPKGSLAPRQGRFTRLCSPLLVQTVKQTLGFGGCHFEVVHGAGSFATKGKDLEFVMAAENRHCNAPW